MTNSFIKVCGVFCFSLLAACSDPNSKIIDFVENKAPIALIELGAPAITLNNSVSISGAASSDPDGDALSYQWSIQNENGEEYKLADNTVKTFVFTPENIGNYQLTLIVRDYKLSSKAMTITITVKSNEQSFPTAVASYKNSNKVGKVSRFSADNSKAAEGQLLSYLWQIQSKPPTSKSVIGDETKVKGYLITDVAGTYEVLLTVTNVENKLTATERITIVAQELLINSMPVAITNASMPSYNVNQRVRLNASASYDSDNEPLKYRWTVKNHPTVDITSISAFDSEFFEFQANAEGDYLLTLRVSDSNSSHETWQKITVTSQNIAPIANAGADKLLALAIPYQLDGADSTDAEGETLQYKWSLVSKPSTSSYSDLDNTQFTDAGLFSFKADVVGEYVLALQVFDGVNYSIKDHVYIEVTANQRPVAIVPDDVVSHSNSRFSASGFDSYDPEGQPLSYFWQVISAPVSALALGYVPSRLSYIEVFIDLPGTYTMQLIVNDGIQDSLPATINFVYTAEVARELTVLGQFVDSAGLPLAIAEINGVFQRKTAQVASNDDGYFEIMLKGQENTLSLSLLTLVDEKTLPIDIRIPVTNEQEIDLGQVTLPTLQRKDVSLTACAGYSGAETVNVEFYLTTIGFNDMLYRKKMVKELTIGEKPVQMRLPATSSIYLPKPNFYLDNGKKLFVHQYQADDSQVDPLNITVCN